MKSDLIDKLGIFLLKDGFTVKTLKRSCFDLLARKESKILLIKVLEDANSISKDYVEQMKLSSAYIGATPLLIAEKAGKNLDNNVVYTRFNMHTLNYATFINSIKNKFPFLKKSQAGLTASIAGKKLKEMREDMGMSFHSLSKKIGVTSRMVARYEAESSEVTFNKAIKIYNIFGKNVFNEIDIFSGTGEIKSSSSSNFTKKYIELGFEAADTQKTPFDIIARKDNELILTEIGDKAKPDFSSVSKLLDADNLVIFKNKKPKHVPSISRKEFLEFEEANELIKFLKEF